MRGTVDSFQKRAKENISIEEEPGVRISNFERRVSFGTSRREKAFVITTQEHERLVPQQRETQSWGLHTSKNKGIETIVMMFSTLECKLRRKSLRLLHDAYLLVLLSTVTTTRAFVSPTSVGKMTTASPWRSSTATTTTTQWPLSFSSTAAMQEALRVCLPDTTKSWDGIMTLVVATEADTTTVPFDSAFQDEINFVDEPVKIALAVFGVVILILTVLSALSSKVDDAILQTIRDFETTMKTYYPGRWKRIEDEIQSQGLTGDERDIKLMKIMEEIQEKEPAVMTEIRQKMDF
eukprot:scaffold3946_cov177-Amphora_coffeaeformis.AAC.22